MSTYPSIDYIEDRLKRLESMKQHVSEELARFDLTWLDFTSNTLPEGAHDELGALVQLQDKIQVELDSYAHICIWLAREVGMEGHEFLQAHWPGVNSETKRKGFYTHAPEPRPLTVPKPVRLRWGDDPSPVAYAPGYWTVQPEKFKVAERVWVMGYLPDTNTIYVWER